MYLHSWQVACVLLIGTRHVWLSEAIYGDLNGSQLPQLSESSKACRAPEAMRRPRPELKAKYGELVQYRDKIFKEHFPSISPSDLALSMKK